MIKSTQITIPKLKFEYIFSQYLKKSKTFIRWTPDLEFAIYKFNEQFQYHEYRISLQHLGIQMFRIDFLESSDSYFLLGSGRHENLFTIFVLGLQKQELVFVKIIKIEDVQKIDRVIESNQVYKLKGDFNVIDFSQFPHIEEYVFAKNVQSYDILYFQQCQLLKLQRNTQNEYYLLPLTQNSRPVKYNPKLTNSIILRDRAFQDDIWIDVVTRITQIYFSYKKKKTVGHYFPTNYINKFHFSDKFGVIYDSRSWVKCFQIYPKQKVLRRIRNIAQLRALQFQSIFCQNYANQYFIYDFLTGQHSQIDALDILEVVNFQIYINFLMHMDLPNHKLIYAIEER